MHIEDAINHIAAMPTHLLRPHRRKLETVLARLDADSKGQDAANDEEKFARDTGTVSSSTKAANDRLEAEVATLRMQVRTSAASRVLDHILFNSMHWTKTRMLGSIKLTRP